MARQLHCNQPVSFPIYGPVQVLGAAPAASSNSTPCQDYPGATMASDPSLPTLESRLSGGKAPWVWEDDLVHAESGLALECRIGRCREPHIIVGKNGCFYYAVSACGTQAQGQLPRHSQLSCLE